MSQHMVDATIDRNRYIDKELWKAHKAQRAELMRLRPKPTKTGYRLDPALGAPADTGKLQRSLPQVWTLPDNSRPDADCG